MGKGKGKKGGKKGGKASADNENVASQSTMGNPPPPKELLLQRELDELVAKIGTTKLEINQLKLKQKELQGEANSIRIENHQYMSYIEKKKNKRKDQIVTLTDNSNAEIGKIEDRKTELLEQFTDEKARLNSILIEKQQMLAEKQHKLNSLADLKEIRAFRLAEIDRLEKEIIRQRSDNSKKMQELQANLESERQRIQQAADGEIQRTTNEAQRQAIDYMERETSQTQKRNAQLRKELLETMRAHNALKEHREKIIKQNESLQREVEHAKKLSKIRTQKQLTLAEQLGLSDVISFDMTAQEAEDFAPLMKRFSFADDRT